MNDHVHRILITNLSFDFSNQEKSVLDKAGEIIGLCLFQEMVEITCAAGNLLSAARSCRVAGPEGGEKGVDRIRNF